MQYLNTKYTSEVDAAHNTAYIPVLINATDVKENTPVVDEVSAVNYTHGAQSGTDVDNTDFIADASGV